MKNLSASFMLFVALTLAVPAIAQSQLITDDPRVRAAVEEITTKNAAMTIAAASKLTGPERVFGPVPTPSTPPVVLHLNRSQFSERDTLQSSLIVPGTTTPLPAGPVQVSHLWINFETGQVRIGFAGTHLLLPGNTIPVQSYIFDGAEPSGLYAYVVMVFDGLSGQLIAAPGTTFVFRNFWRFDSQNYVRVDSAEFRGKNFLLRGNFSPFTPAFVAIGKGLFPIYQSSMNEAYVDVGDSLPSGIYDVTLVVRATGNTSYDSVTAPGVVKIFLPR